MGFWDFFWMGTGLAADAVCVSISNGIGSGKSSRIRNALKNSLTFGIFQGFMPFLGYLAGFLIADPLLRYSRFLVFLVFLCLGVKMFVSDDSPQTISVFHLTLRLLLVQGFATSIDALAAGISLRILNADLTEAIIIISSVTFLLSLLAFLTGQKLQIYLKTHTSRIGGSILLALAFKLLLLG